MLPIQQTLFRLSDVNQHKKLSEKLSSSRKNGNSYLLSSETSVDVLSKQKDIDMLPSLIVTKENKSRPFRIENYRIHLESDSASRKKNLSTDATVESEFSCHWRSSLPNHSFKQKKDVFSPIYLHSNKRYLFPSHLKTNERPSSVERTIAIPPKYLPSAIVPTNVLATKFDNIVSKSRSSCSNSSIHEDYVSPESTRTPNCFDDIPDSFICEPHNAFEDLSTPYFYPQISSNLIPTRNTVKTATLKVNMTTDLSVPAIFEALRESKRFKHIIGTAFPSLAVSSSIPESSSSPSPTLRTLNQRTLTHSPIIPRTPPTLSDSQAHVLIRTGNLMNAEFQVPMSIIGLSKTLLHILKCSSLFLEYHEKCIRLPSIESNTFQCILEYFMNGNSKAWEPPDEQILEIAEAAFYLNFPQIVDVCVQRGVTLFNYIETLDGLSTSVLHIFLKQLSIKQLLYAEKKLISKEQHFDMKPYWLSHLYKHATPLHALESCFQWTTDSIRDYLHPPISLPLFVSSSHISSVKLNSRRRYFIPKENLSDTVIRFYRDIFEQCSFHVHLKLKQCEEVKFPMFSFSNLKENPKETKHKYVRMKPDASMTIGETSDQGKKPERNDYVEVTSLNPEVFLVDAPLVEIHGVHLSFPTKLQGSLLSSWPITHLTLEDCVLSNAQFSNFCHWIQFKSHLKSVSIHRCFEACQLSGFFQSLGFHPSLAKIELSPIPKKEETFDKSVLKGMTSLPTISNLKQLHLQHFLFLPSCLRGVLDMIQLCHLHLVHLQLSHLRVGTQVTHLLQVTWPHLTHLNFEDTSLPPSTLLVFLAHLTTSFPKLVHLNLSHNTFTASILEHLCSILPQTCLKEFLFNLRTPVTMEDILYVRLFSQGLPDSLTFLALENHDLPWPDLLAFISTRSLYLHCSLDKKYRRELKKIIKQSTFPIMIWCDTILTNISLHK